LPFGAQKIEHPKGEKAPMLETDSKRAGEFREKGFDFFGNIKKVKT